MDFEKLNISNRRTLYTVMKHVMLPLIVKAHQFQGMCVSMISGDSIDTLKGWFAAK